MAEELSEQRLEELAMMQAARSWTTLAPWQGMLLLMWQETGREFNSHPPHWKVEFGLKSPMDLSRRSPKTTLHPVPVISSA